MSSYAVVLLIFHGLRRVFELDRTNTLNLPDLFTQANLIV
jgi:hypothetical protein